MESISFVVGLVIGFSFCKCINGDCRYMLKIKQCINKVVELIKDKIFTSKKPTETDSK